MRVSTGLLASGSVFISSEEAKLAFNASKGAALGNPVAVEMENAGVAQICKAYDKPYLSLRAPELTRTPRRLRWVRRRYAYQPPALGTYRTHRAACPRAPRTVRTGYAYQPRALGTYSVLWQPRCEPAAVGAGHRARECGPHAAG